MGYECNEKHVTTNIKAYIMEILDASKKGKEPKWEEMSKILSNIETMDHHDLVRTDQIMTRQANKKETVQQWGSIVMNCKWNTL